MMSAHSQLSQAERDELDRAQPIHLDDQRESAHGVVKVHGVPLGEYGERNIRVQQYSRDPTSTAFRVILDRDGESAPIALKRELVHFEDAFTGKTNAAKRRRG